MNTPKLNSIISSALSTAAPSRLGQAADPMQGLDFSRLLGEKRSQSSAAAPVSRPVQNDRGPSRQALTPSENRTTSNRQHSTPSTGPAHASETSSQPKDTPQAAPQQPANTQADARTATDTPADTQPATAEAAQDPNTTEHNTELAHAAAEAGAVSPLTSQTAQGPIQAATTVQTQGLNPAAAAAGDIAHPTGQGPLAATAGAALSSEEAAAPLAQPLPATRTAHSTPAGAPAVQGQAQAAAPQIPGDAPALKPLASALPDNTLPTSDTPSSKTALPLPVSNDVPATAAALSLQDFTAMVAAARATSGTSLAPATAIPPAATLSATTIAGLLPGGLVPGQMPATAATGAGVPAPLSSPQWPAEFGRQFISIAQASKGLGQIAELRLDPPELGPLRITINLNDNVAHAVISSPHALVRQTVENALPQLQQMLEQAGISLGQANVNDQHQPGHPGQHASGQGPLTANGPGGAGTETSDLTDAGRPGRSQDPNALVDTFA